MATRKPTAKKAAAKKRAAKQPQTRKTAAQKPPAISKPKITKPAAQKAPAITKPAAAAARKNVRRALTPPGSAAAPTSEPPRRRYPQQLCKVRITAEFEPSGARAAGVRSSVAIADHRDDVVDVLFDNGVRYISSFEQFRADFGDAQSRDATAVGQFTIPAVVVVPGAERGVGTLVIKALRFLGIDPVEAAAELTAVEVCQWYEQKQLHHVSPEDTNTQRLWQVRAGDEFGLSLPAKPLPTGQPLLIFLHGTASSSRGSFGELWAPNGRDVRAEILGPYGDRVYAFEHYTLTQSPIQNALALLDELPDGARLHLISHSRGGLVGELLCRAQTIDRDPFEDDEIKALFGERDYQKQGADLRLLSQRLKQKAIRVERFARVACPARGTTLAAQRMDRWLSVSLNLIGEVADLASCGFYEVFEEFVKAFLNTKSKPGQLPGLEAMMPTSPLVRLLNRADVTTSADLHVVAGDIEGGGLLRRLGVLLTDLYYREDHDLVVNTRAMYGGTPRVTPPRRYFAQGPDVYHFTYFKNRDTARKVAAALHQSSAQDGFAAFDQQDSATPRDFRPMTRSARDAGGAKPIVFVLPGIMGSLLEADGKRVWIDIGALNRGGMEKLAIDASGVKPVGLVNDTYASLVDYLGRTHDVVAFPFDWRLSLRAEAKRLAEALGPWLDEADRRGQPLSIIAHSLGGLLARVLIADFPKVWERLIAKPQGRLLQLGTPNGGSYSIPLMLVGREGLVQKLALLDFKHRQRELLALIAAFPGVLELMPAHAAPDFFAPATWTRLQALDIQDGGKWKAPDEPALTAAAAVRAVLDRPMPDLDHVVYVAGLAPQTPCKLSEGAPPAGIGGPEGSVFPMPSDAFYFESTAEGDGRVPWSTGILSGVRTFYMNAVHGDLAATPAHFDALRDLLTTGTTDRLPTTPPVTAKRGAASAVYRSRPVDYVPDATDFEAEALGRAHHVRAAAPAATTIEVSVTHGNLAFARSPVFVGHYAGDAVISAEEKIDGWMGGRLKRNHALGLYPSRLNTAKAFLGATPAGEGMPEFPGAVVVGLGDVGEMTPSSLTATFQHAVLTYVVARIEAMGHGGDAATLDAKVTTLLIGTGWNAIPVRDCVSALLRGVVRANETLARSTYQDRVRIAEIEFIELYQDRAIQAVRALQIAQTDQELASAIRANTVLQTITGGRTRAFFEEGGSWWNRLQIAGEKDGTLKFTMLTDRARAETTLQPTQRVLVDRFVERQIATTDTEKHLAVTLFELLLPNALKDEAPEGRDLVLVLDEESARYPWELLQDGLVPDESGYEGVEQARVALRAGLVRQLQTPRFRAVVTHTNQRNALVIGDPKIDMPEFPDLPGALHEAETVAGALGDGGGAAYKVKALYTPGAEQVVHALFEKPYRIVHLAGHGVYEFPLPPTATETRQAGAGAAPAQRKVTGMVLGQGIFLTPAEIGQMRMVPELVFINCCHLGRVGPDRADGAPTASRHLLAANLATAFIEMGVKVVVAAGWAVQDQAASLFAKTFYEQLLAGVPFGRAVHAARRQTANEFPAYNTWGAYQCYGDYAYRLELAGGSGSGGQRQEFASASELAIELANMGSDAQTARPADLDWLNQRADGLLAGVAGERAGWLGLASIRTAFGSVLGELDRFDEALDHYGKAMAANAADFPVKAIEQYANLLSRAAVAQVRATAGSTPGKRKTRAGTDATPLDKAREKIARASELLMNLLTVARTSERLALLGSAAKRLAWVEDSPQRRRAALAAMRSHYKEANTLALLARGELNPYPALNWMAAEACIAAMARAGAKAVPPNTQPELADLTVKVGQQLDKVKDRDFWGYAQYADLALVKPLLAHSFDAKARTEVVEKYRQAYARAGSPRQMRSVVDHVEFLAAMFDGARDPTVAGMAAELANCAQALHELVQDDVDEEKAAAGSMPAAAVAKRRPRKTRRKAARTTAATAQARSSRR